MKLIIAAAVAYRTTLPQTQMVAKTSRGEEKMSRECVARKQARPKKASYGPTDRVFKSLRDTYVD
jgi:hypothetical protein